MARRWTTLAMAGSAGVVMLAAASAWTLGPGGAWVTTRLAEGRDVWRLGKLHVDHVSGSSLSDLTIGRLTLSDKSGVWLDARDIAIRWRPLALLGGEAHILSIAGDSITVLRTPTLSPPPPAGRAMNVTLDALRLANLHFEKAAFGADADFVLDGALATKAGSVKTARLRVTGTGATRDSASIDLAGGAELALRAHVDGPAKGFFANAFGAQDPVAIDLTANGDTKAGSGRFAASVGRKQLARAKGGWTADHWSLTGAADFRPAPALDTLARAVGDTVQIDASGVRGATSAITLHAQGSDAELSLTGPIDGAMTIRARAAHLEAFTPGVSHGAGRLDGVVTRTRDAATFKGTFETTGFQSGVLETGFKGPLVVRLTRSAADIKGEGVLSEVRGAAIMPRLLENAKLSLKGRFDRSTHVLALQDSRLEGPKVQLTGAGSVGPGAKGLTGRWRIADARMVEQRLSGVAAGQYTLTGGFARRPFSLTLQGTGEHLKAGLGPLDPLLGDRPRLDAQLEIQNGVVTVQRATATGPRLRLGARGAVRQGQASLVIEAAAKGPVSIGAMTIDGVAAANGSLTGSFDALSLALETNLSMIDVAGVVIRQPQVTLTLAPTRVGRSGHLTLEGGSQGGTVRADADIDIADGAVQFTRINAQVGGLSARGDAALGPYGPRADLTLQGSPDALSPSLRGTLAGRVRLTSSQQLPSQLAVQMRLTRGRYGALTINEATISADGPLERLSTRATLLGAASGAKVDLDLSGFVAHVGDATRLSVQPSGAIAGAGVRANGPLEIVFTRDAVEAHGDLAFDDGIARFDFADSARKLSLTARLNNAPIAPIAALFGEEASGRATGSLTASGDDALAATFDMQIVDALFERRARDPVSMKLKGEVSGGRLMLNARASSRNGLDAAIEMTAPVATRARPLRVALNGEGRATWRAKGPADALWGVVGSLDQNVSGNIDGDGVLHFSAGRLSGEGGLRLEKGRFMDRQTGVDLRDVSAQIEFDDKSARLSRFFARDSRGGEVTGTGAAQGLATGRIDLMTHNVRLLNRPESSATGSGPLSLTWTKDGATLAGDLTLDSALLTPSKEASSIPVLDVEEINRPDGDDAAPTGPAPAQSFLPRTALDVRVRAPARVLVRGRGLDSEWSLDVRAKGYASDPQLFGEARLVRGTFTLAGRPFEAQSGTIRFNGAPREALINLVAQLEATNLTVTATLSGPVSAPDATLTSTLSLPEDEVLPQALFGRAAADLSGLEAAQLAASLAEISGQSTLNLTGAARDLIGLDRLDVRDTATGLRVAGGKYLTRNVYLELARSGQGQAETQVEWRLRPQLNIVSAFQATGDSKLSVRWRREY